MTIEPPFEDTGHSTPDETRPTCQQCGARLVAMPRKPLRRRMNDWAVGTLGIVGPEYFMPILRCLGCERDDAFLAGTPAWPTVIELRERHQAGELSATEFVAVLERSVRSQLDRTAIGAEVRHAVEFLAGNSGFAAWSGRPSGATTTVPWPAVVAAFDDDTGRFRLEIEVDPIVIARQLPHDLLGPNTLAAMWIADPRPTTADRDGWISGLLLNRDDEPEF